MRRIAVLMCVTSLLLPTPSFAQAPRLLDPAKAPMTLKGGWIHYKTGARSDIVIRIESVQPDGSFTGKLDFYNADKHAHCKVFNGPIEEGKVTDKMLRVLAQAENPKECPTLKLTFRTGGEKFLEGSIPHGKMWLDAPK